MMNITDSDEAKVHLSRLLERVQQGEEIIIGESGKPVAKLVPYVQSDEPRCDGQWQGMKHAQCGNQ